MMSTATAPTIAEGHGVPNVAGGRPRRFGTRRRALLLGCAAVLLVLAAAANYGPLHEWRDARARLEKKQAQVADLSHQQAQLEAQLKKLGDSSYLEGLVRQDLTYARPGEDVFIVSGLSGGASGQASTPAAGAAAGQKPGILERMLSALGRVF